MTLDGFPKDGVASRVSVTLTVLFSALWAFFFFPSISSASTEEVVNGVQVAAPTKEPSARWIRQIKRRMKVRGVSVFGTRKGKTRLRKIASRLAPESVIDLDSSPYENFQFRLNAPKRSRRRLHLSVQRRGEYLANQSNFKSQCGNYLLTIRNRRGIVLHMLSVTLTSASRVCSSTSEKELPAQNERLVYRLNGGGGEVVDENGAVWSDDISYQSGPLSSIYTVESPIEGTDIPSVYQSERYGEFSYRLPVANGEHRIVFHVAELYWNQPGRRIFSARIEGTEVIKDLDLFLEFGERKASQISIPVSVEDGELHIEFFSSRNFAAVGGVEVFTLDSRAPGTPTPSASPFPSAEPSPTPSPSPTPAGEPSEPLYRLNSGGNNIVDRDGNSWGSDTSYLLGTYSAFETDTAIANTDFDELYQSERYGDFRYELAVPNGEVTVVLHLAEIYWQAAGERIFSVVAEGAQAIIDLDLFVEAGPYVATTRQISTTVSDGSLSLEFSPITNNATVSGIEVYASGDIPPTPTPSPSSTPTPTPSPTATPSPSSTPMPTSTPSVGDLTAIWANDGGDKVTQDELRVSSGTGPRSVNRTFDGTTVNLFGARNEVISFNVILEAATSAIQVNNVSLHSLSGPGGYQITSLEASGDELFNYVGRNIELFYIRYLQIQGLSRLFYENYDERHIPERLRRSFTGEGYGSGTWFDRPDRDKFYPDIAVPLELELPFTVQQQSNQSIWADIYIPKGAPPGDYTGQLKVTEADGTVHTLPVELTVHSFTLPDEPSSQTMLYLGYTDTNLRYLGQQYPSGAAAVARSIAIRDRHFQMAHRHKISLIDSNNGAHSWGQDRPRPDWEARLDGSLYTEANGYDGPGKGVGNGVFSIGTYSTWNWQSEGQAEMWERTNNWTQWFLDNSPQTEFFLYLIDESLNYEQINTWATWINQNPGIGSLMPSFATISLPNMIASTPQLDIGAGWMASGITSEWQSAVDYLTSTDEKKAYMYNGKRPASGSFAIEDDGVALRELPWGQYKKEIDRWFYWESTYYNNFQGGTGQTNVFQRAQTFGGRSGFHPVLGETGWNYSNGDGVLFYPGTDTIFPEESYGVNGPIASLRLKYWRRGIQDIDYVTLAYAVNPVLTTEIVQQMVPEVMWEPGVSDPDDPTWIRTEISWSTDPDDWEAAREALANIISGAQ